MVLYLENDTDKIFEFDTNEIATKVMEQTLNMEKCPYETEINLLLTDNTNIRMYNKEYRNIDKETDVLSFPNLNFEKESEFVIPKGYDADFINPETGNVILGDIIISVDKVSGQATEYGHSEKREFAFLIAHSMLHLCGYDHMTEKEAKIMEQKQKEVLDKLGITRDQMRGSYI